MNWRRTAALGALFLAACPALETPVATVSGRIVGASVGASAYPFGRPDLKVATDADGAFRIEGVPTSVSSVVIFDGADRAERVVVRLRGGEENRIADRFGAGAGVSDAERMPVAATVLAAVTPEGGAAAVGTSYTVVGTDLADRQQGPGEVAVALGPLPAGTFEVRAGLAGFLDGAAPVEAIAASTVALAIALPIDADSAAPGCRSGVGCLNALACGHDGLCYPCTDSEGCAAGEICDTSLGLCRPTIGPATWVCAACYDDSGCDSGSGLRCLVRCWDTAGYCTLACTAARDCPAGFDCANGRCTAPEGCAHWFQTMGAPCVESEECNSHLLGGRCSGPANSSGYCTARCSIDQDCRIGTGTASTMTCSGSWCALP